MPELFARSRLGRFRPARPTLVTLLVVTVAGLAACGTTRAVTPAPTATPTATSTFTTAPAGTVLFFSDWSKGLADWQPSAGWTVRDGMLEMDGQDARTLTIPYQPTVRDYAVIYTVQVLNEPQDGGYFRLVAPPTATAAGFHAEIQGLHTDIPHPTGDHPHAWVYLDPTDRQDPKSVHTSDFEPQTRIWTYHVEVRGNAVRFATDGGALSAATATTNAPLSHGPLTIRCGLAFLRFGQIQIIAL